MVLRKIASEEHLSVAAMVTMVPSHCGIDGNERVDELAKETLDQERAHKLISSEGGQDTSAYKISGHSLHAFPGKCPETPNLSPFTKSK